MPDPFHRPICSEYRLWSGRGAVREDVIPRELIGLWLHFSVHDKMIFPWLNYCPELRIFSSDAIAI
jgi:hypothetical protein